MRRHAALRILLGVLFVLACAHQARDSLGALRALVDWQQVPRRPFHLASGAPIVSSVDPLAASSGLRPGDRIASVEGVALTGTRALESALDGLRAGDALTVELEDGRSLEVVVPARRAAPPGTLDWSIVIVLQGIMPALCLVLGFWAAGLRPRDALAWLLLALLVSFSLTARDRDMRSGAGALGDLELLYETLCAASWPIWMMLFGIYFPDRLRPDRRWPWAKWILIGPMAIFILGQAYAALWERHSFAMALPVARLLEPARTAMAVVGMLCISVFFAGFGMKTGMTAAPDARRRLQLLFAGSFAGLTPMFVVVVTGLVRGRDPFASVPAWLAIAALLLLFLFPFTLAYVIVVHRALDLRVVIRQGIQYAFARQGLIVLRIVLWAGVLAAILAAASRPDLRRAEILAILLVGGLAAITIGRTGAWLIRWTDRRFFREVYSAEQILNDLSEQVRTMVETAPLLETVARRLSDSLHVPRVAVLLREAGIYRPAHALGYAGPPLVALDDAMVTVERLRRHREPLKVYLDDPESWAGKGAQGEERSMLELLGCQLLLPLTVKEEMPGIISLGAKLSEEPFSAADLRLLRSVATQTGLALENSRLASLIASEVARRERLNREIEIAREVQERLFPQRLPAVPGLDYAGRCRPALGVGGDYFDFIELGDGGFGVAIADVSGKGIGAALLMASLQASLRGQTIQDGVELATLVGNVNRLVYEASPDNRYATFFYGRYDPASRVLRYVNAGHCPPVILRAGRGPSDAIRLKTGGTVVGLFRDTKYAAGEVALQPGDLLVAYTDGISEALNPEEEEWGEAALIASATRCAGLAASVALDRLLSAADAFASGAEQHDDMTLVVMRAV